MAELIKITNLHASIQGKEILKGVNLTINSGEIHAIMGKNGSGKSTLSNIIMGHPSYEVTQGDILFRGESILNLKTDERAKKGIFLCFQYPTATSMMDSPVEKKSETRFCKCLYLNLYFLS